MKLSKHNLNNDQPKTLSKRDDKKSVNIKWNSKLFFQLSLIVSLLIVYSVMQARFETREKALVTPRIDFLEEPPMIIYTLDEPEKVQKKKVVKKQPKIKVKIINKINIAEKGSVLETDLSEYNKPNTNDSDIPEKTTAINVVPKAKKIINVLGVEHVPVFPGCESLTSNIEKRNCMSLKIKAFIQRKFNTDKFDNINTKGKQKITVQFYVDETGNVSGVKAKALDKNLEKEAIRVVSKLPQMEPGKQGGKAVKVQYTIPIVFKID
ncbi:MAG: energy transducer TonB [Bacteroidetes bacterium]|nr:energy transducer TonB [Bacteroidota bacterium]